MTSTSLLSIGSRAMAAAMAQLTVTGNNISNANVAGYSRQSVRLETAGGQFTGAGYFGRGVNVATVTRSYDQYLAREASTSSAIASRDAARLGQLQRLEQVFPTGEKGLGYAVGELVNSFVDVANAPQDLSARQVVLSQAESVAARFRDASSQLDELQEGVRTELENSVATVNQLTANIAKLNERIVATQGSQHAPNDLLDQRDQLVRELSKFVGVSTVESDNGALSVFTANGQQLVGGTSSTPLQVIDDPYDSTRVQLGVANGAAGSFLPADSLGGGSLAGTLQFQDHDLVDARNMLGQMAAALSGAINEQQALGLDLSNPATAGAPIFSVGAPIALPASTNQRGASGYAANVTLTVSDASALQASEYDLRADPAGSGGWLMTRLSDGQETVVNDGDTVDGFTINLGTPAPAATDRFRLQPAARAAGGMQRVLEDPKGIAAASPVTGTVAAANTGTMTVASVAAADTTLDRTLTAVVTFSSDTGDYNWELRDASNAVVSAGSASWTAGSTISLNGFALKLNGVPKSGDVVTVAPTTDPRASNGNALALAGLGTAKIVDGASVTDAYANAMTTVGVRVQSAKTASEISTGVAADAEASRSGQAGVNLDEEAARLIQYQQAYQASAKVLQVAQTIFDSLLQAAAR